MEANQHEDSKSSSEETDRSEQGNDDLGTGRSYECVFCKRGFTTAQALGGHMNIHRKDRAKSRPSSVPSVTSKVIDDNYASLGSYQPIQSYLPHYSTAPHEVHVNYQTFLPASTWVMRSPHVHNSDDSYVQNPHHHLNPFDEDWRRENLSLQLGPSHIDDDGKEKRQGGNIEEDDLDLELRLGHDP